MNKIALVQFSSYGDALQAAHTLFKSYELELVELSPQQGQALMIFRGSNNQVESFLKEMRYETVLRSVSVQDDPRLFEHYFSLKIGQVSSFLACAEGGFVGDLFVAGEMALLLGLTIVELRPSKNLNFNGYLLVTGKQRDALEAFGEAVRSLHFKVNVFNETCEKFRSYMNQP
jgi:hypothetical protein